MEFIARQSSLLRELNLVQGVVERKHTVPILANVLLEAAEDSITVSATDLDMSVRSSMTAGVTQPGALSVSARKLHEIVKALPDSEVHIKADGENWASITCERAHFRIMGMTKEDFPALPKPGKGKRITFGIQQFREMVHKVIFAVTQEDARFALNGALLFLSKGAINLVASDGHRLALVSWPHAGGTEADLRVVIPHKALSELSRIGEEIGGEIIISREENQIFFEMGRCLLSSKLLEGSFPNFEKVIPTGNDKILELDRANFTDAVRRVSLVSSDRSRAIKLSLASGRLELSAKNPELGEARESLNVDYKGAELQIGFNARYILDFLAAVDTQSVTLELKDEAAQGLLRPVKPAAPASGKGKAAKGAEAPAVDYKYVIMPMRI